MNVTPLEPDTAAILPAAPRQDGSPFAAILDAAAATLDRAANAERAFARGAGGLLEMTVERASADVMLQIAATAAQRTTQALATIVGMQV
ncbi:MAG: hypothetical protein JO101_08445 [Candidatus Eremiobacteraeota bacterium]|nr:hypothetical protein [Candidatus Eremiobacteraeota bacterium]MBV8355333.1 hypothetical protein [Candidatus Eremiobacteraeota bacterium]